jgi:hypothetical protein
VRSLIRLSGSSPDALTQVLILVADCRIAAAMRQT